MHLVLQGPLHSRLRWSFSLPLLSLFSGDVELNYLEILEKNTRLVFNRRKKTFFTIKDGEINSCIGAAKSFGEAEEADGTDSDYIVSISPKDLDFIIDNMVKERKS